MKEAQLKGIIRIYGSIENYKEHLHKKLSKHFYTNGIIDRKFYDGEEIPEGFRPGRSHGRNDTTGSRWITNGIEEHLFYGDVPPEGYHFGKLPQSDSHRKRISKALTGKERSAEHCKNLSISHKTETYKKKIAKTNMERYGAENPFQAEIFRDKIYTQEAIKHRFESMSRNKTFAKSKTEDALYGNLINIFGEENVKRQYSSECYPFHCDFYIVSENLYIELNAHWTHGGCIFDKTNKEHLEKVAFWESKSASSKFYKTAIDVWTVRDVNKYDAMLKNNLNYLIIYSNNKHITNIEESLCQKILQK